jgi:hypothetical protein
MFNYKTYEKRPHQYTEKSKNVCANGVLDANMLLPKNVRSQTVRGLGGLEFSFAGATRLAHNEARLRLR